jgi:hypothetical protein
MLHPIGFCIPEKKIVDHVPAKEKLIATYVPKFRHETPYRYIYNDEKDYYDDYRKSLFARTKKKAGWDCLRHYEILAQGTIPLFEKLEECPAGTLTFLPKEKLLEARDLLKKHIMPEGADHEKLPKELNLECAEVRRCMEIAQELLEYTRNHLTTKQMAQYVLDASDHSRARRVLYISGLGRYGLVPNYMRDLLLQGFKELLGSECHDVPRVPHIYDNYGNVRNLYGKGFTYTKNIPSYCRDATKDTTCEPDLRNHIYDVIIYGSYHDGTPMLNEVLKYYGKKDIVMVCGDDIHECDYQKLVDEGYIVFVRELSQTLE